MKGFDTYLNLAVYLHGLRTSAFLDYPNRESFDRLMERAEALYQIADGVMEKVREQVEKRPDSIGRNPQVKNDKKTDEVKAFVLLFYTQCVRMKDDKMSEALMKWLKGTEIRKLAAMRRYGSEMEIFISLYQEFRKLWGWKFDRDWTPLQEGGASREEIGLEQLEQLDRQIEALKQELEKT